VFFFCGLEFAFSCFVMIISQEYFNQGKLLIKLLEHAVRNSQRSTDSNFSRNDIEHEFLLDEYELNLLIIWVISFALIMYTMAMLLLQFFAKAPLEGEHSRFVAKMRIAVNLFSLLIITGLATICGFYLFRLAITVGDNHRTVGRITGQLKSERSNLDFLQKRLQCAFNSGDRSSHNQVKSCREAVEGSLMSYGCAYWMFFAFVIIHGTMFILLVLLNATEKRGRQFAQDRENASLSYGGDLGDEEEKSRTNNNNKNGFLLPK